MITESYILECLSRGEVTLQPLSLRLLQQTNRAVEFDACIEVSWQKKKSRFAAEIRSRSNPKAFQEAVARLKVVKRPDGYLPMIIMPYLKEEHLEELEQQSISGIDLCGNGVVIVPDSFAVFKTGGRNRFPTYAPIKNIYRKNSSMVARAFLAQPQFPSVQDIRDEINRMNLLVTEWQKVPMSLSTVSKSLKTLEADLIVGRKEGIRLLQAEKLLEKLAENYAPPKIRNRLQLKVEASEPSLFGILMQREELSAPPLTATGLSSIRQYAVMQRGDMLSVYCPRIDYLLERLNAKPTDRFPNLELIETDDETVYFDSRLRETFRWASPVQTYLELMSGDKRDRETASQVSDFLLRELAVGRE